MITSGIFVHYSKVGVISAYAPNGKSAVSEKEKFYTGLTKICIVEKTAH